MSNTSVKFEGFSFNTEWVLKFKTEADFLAHPKNINRWKDNNEKKLKELYSIVVGEKPTSKKQAKEDKPPVDDQQK